MIPHKHKISTLLCIPLLHRSVYNNSVQLMLSPNLVEIEVKESQVYELLKLQQLFHSHYLTEELLNAMITLYVKFVENIHHNRHPLRIFFMEKIRFVLSRPEVLSILERTSEQQNKHLRETIRGMVGVTQQEELLIRRMAEEAKEEIRQNHVINMKKERNYEKGERGEYMREKERNIKIEMQVRIMEEVEQNMLKMKRELNHDSNSKNERINRIVQKQDVALNERLAKRRNRLRKKSLDNQNTESGEVEAPTPLARQQLLEMNNELQQTYQRFTRLTMNKRNTQAAREKQGRVKVKVQQAPIFEEDIFEQLQKAKATHIEESVELSETKNISLQNIHQQSSAESISKPQIITFELQQAKMQLKTQQQLKEPSPSIEPKACDPKKGRVTVRQNNQPVEDEQLF